MQNYFLQPVFVIFTRGAIDFDHDCIARILSLMIAGCNIKKNVLIVVLLFFLSAFSKMA